MIVLDTHIWVWWAHGSEQLTSPQAQIIEANETNGIGISAISVWEVAKLVQYNRLDDEGRPAARQCDWGQDAGMQRE